jgi:hypothetical protein
MARSGVVHLSRRWCMRTTSSDTIGPQ